MNVPLRRAHARRAAPRSPAHGVPAVSDELGVLELHTSVGMAFVGAVVGEYLGSAAGVGYLILQAEAVFDINTVLAGIVVLTAFALALDGLVTFAEKRLLVWRPTQGETEPL